MRIVFVLLRFLKGLLLCSIPLFRIRIYPRSPSHPSTQRVLSPSSATQSQCNPLYFSITNPTLPPPVTIPPSEYNQ